MSRGAYARGKWALGECARSGRKMLLRNMVADGYYPNLIVDPMWYEPKHPQESLPSLKDPVSLFRPAPDRDNVSAQLNLGGGPSGGLGEDDPVPGGGFGDPGPLPPGPDGTGGGVGGASFSYGYAIGSPSFTIEAGAVLLKDQGFEFVDDSLTSTLDLSAELEVGCQVIVYMVSASNNVRLSSSGPDLRCIIPDHTSSSGFSTGNISGSLWWFPRNDIGDATTFALTSDDAGPGVRWYVFWWVVQNLNQSCPIQNLAWGDPGINVDISGNPDFPCMLGGPQVSSAQSAVLEIHNMHESGAAGTDPVITRKGVTPDHSFNMELLFNSVTRGGWQWTSFYVPGAVGLCENLLPDTGPLRFTAWTISAGAVLTPSVDFIHHDTLIEDGSDMGGPHGIFDTVALTVGVRYCFVFNYRLGDETTWFWGWEDVTNNPGVQNGQFVKMETGAGFPMIDQKTDVGLGWDEDFHPHALDQVMAQSVYFLTAPATGTYRIWLAGASTTDTTTASLVYDASLRNAFVRMNSVSVSTGDFVPPQIPTVGAARPLPTSPLGFLPRTFTLMSNVGGRVWGGSIGRGIVMELCGSVITDADLIQHHEQAITGFLADDDRLGAGNDYLLLPESNSINRSVGFMCGRLAHPAGNVTGATGLYYCEMTVGAVISLAPESLGVYVGIFTAHKPGSESVSASDPGDVASERAWIASYMADGQTHHDGTTVSGLTTYALGDVVGIALDLVAGDVEFFINGVSEATITLSAEFLNATGGAAIPAYVGCVQSDDLGAAVSWAFKAPFAFTKPGGFQDWDYIS